jgi:hypothetical protein
MTGTPNPTSCFVSVFSSAISFLLSNGNAVLFAHEKKKEKKQTGSFASEF